MKVVHVTTVHTSNDIRIFHKECVSLAAEGHEVTLLVAGSGESFVKNGVSVEMVPVRYRNRAGRVINAPRTLARRVKEMKPHLVHFHDPEFLLCTGFLKRKGYIMVYDVHEDLPRQMMSKYWIPKPVRKVLAGLAEWYENRQAARVDYVVAATPHIAERFRQVNRNVTDVRNHSIPGEFLEVLPMPQEVPHFCYIGGISLIRGVREMIMAAGDAGVNLILAGPAGPDVVKEELERFPGYARTTFTGMVERGGLADILCRSVAGLALLHPEPNHMEALPTKIFEYMLAGIPVIASGFPAIRDVVERHQCGICVDPLDVEAITTAFRYIAANPEEARAMGARGREAALAHYNWDLEKKKLSDIYRFLETRRDET
jgi:glycosyltransferase involved in cell wall biosynthesis